MYNAPCGIQVARIESLLFRLLKAVLIPITIKYFLFEVVWTVFKFPNTGESWCTDDSCISLAAAICRELQKGYHGIIPWSWFSFVPKELVKLSKPDHIFENDSFIESYDMYTYKFLITILGFWIYPFNCNSRRPWFRNHPQPDKNVFIIMTCIY